VCKRWTRFTYWTVFPRVIRVCAVRTSSVVYRRLCCICVVFYSFLYVTISVSINSIIKQYQLTILGLYLVCRLKNTLGPSGKVYHLHDTLIVKCKVRYEFWTENLYNKHTNITNGLLSECRRGLESVRRRIIRGPR